MCVCEVSPQLTERDKYECYSQQLKKFSSWVFVGYRLVADDTRWGRQGGQGGQEGCIEKTGLGAPRRRARREPHIILKCFRLWWQRPEREGTMSGMKPASSGCQSCQPQTTNTGGIKNILTKIKFKTNCATLKNHSIRKNPVDWGIEGESMGGREMGRETTNVFAQHFCWQSFSGAWPKQTDPTNTCGYCAS